MADKTTDLNLFGGISVSGRGGGGWWWESHCGTVDILFAYWLYSMSIYNFKIGANLYRTHIGANLYRIIGHIKNQWFNCDDSFRIKFWIELHQFTKLWIHATKNQSYIEFKRVFFKSITVMPPPPTRWSTVPPPTSVALPPLPSREPLPCPKEIQICCFVLSQPSSCFSPLAEKCLFFFFF